MFGTAARLKVLPGKDQEFLDLAERWAREGAAPGELAAYLYDLDGRQGEYMLAVVFQDRESYVQNASAPRTDGFYYQMRALLQADPEWNDGNIIQMPLGGGI